MAQEYREREDKYRVEADWLMPALAEVLPPDGRIAARTVRLSSRYFDTAEQDLLAHRITLRQRSGDVDDGWQSKLPDGDARLELRLPPGDGAEVPAELQRLLLGVRAGRPLMLVAELHTERNLCQLLDAGGQLLAEVADDQVSATVPGGPGVPMSVVGWREVEVELGSGDERLLSTIGRLLIATGAERAGSASKLAQALAGGPAAESAGEPAAGLKPGRPGRDRLAGLVGRYLDEQFQALSAADLELRRGRQPIHQARVATRRYRSVLRVFGDLLEAPRRDALDAELAWYAGLLGQLRDCQVLRAQLADAVASLPSDLVLGPVAATIEEQLAAEQAAARTELDRELSGERYLALSAELTAWHRQPPFTEAARRPAAKVSRYLERAERKLAKRLRTARRAATGSATELAGIGGPNTADELLHRARKAAKRARYTGELARPQLGKRAHRLVKSATALQDRLGEYQDGVVASQLLLRLGAAAGVRPGENGFTYGLLYARLRQRRK